MKIELFNFWYFFWIVLGVALIVGLYFILKNRSQKTQKWILWSFLALGLLLHFLKAFIPPYSLNENILQREIWFINICAANIALFPILFWSKNKYVQDYVFYIGALSGAIALLYPIEPIQKVDQYAEILDIIRFYYHHWMLMAVPVLSLLFGHHKLSYKRVFSAPIGLLLLMLFIMLNQILQSELGFIDLRNDNFFGINYKNTSYIWAPGNDGIGALLSALCPDFFKSVPVGEYAGQTKYWPWFWMICPIFILITPVAFALSMIHDSKTFINDVKTLCSKICEGFLYLKNKICK